MQPLLSPPWPSATMIGMTAAQGFGAVELLGQHGPNKEVGPRCTTEGKDHIRLLRDRQREAIRSANQESSAAA